ncbi:MAG: NAD(P)H-hydrate dehydratase [Oscillospiraceae bacterium]|nr:NAD(P)H-hydrate dehydratase [Oscillospiraceae bacterium]
MDFIVTSDQMKTAEQNAVRRGVPLRTLAENAANACFANISALVGSVREKTFTILCGKGNNGGDGLLIAELLKEAGAEVLCVFLTGLPASDPARGIFARRSPNLPTVLFAEREESVKTALVNSHIVLDCVFGTGFKGELDLKTAELFRYVNENCKALKISIDLPSGIDSDSGARAACAFIPNVTYVLGAYKKSMFSHPAGDFCGELVLLDIGLTVSDFNMNNARLIDSSIMFCRPKRLKNSHKGSYGKLLNIAGSERYIGAAQLSTKAAVRAGAGLVTLASPGQVVFSIASAVPEAVFLPLEVDKSGFINDSALKAIPSELQKATAVSIGCGLGVTAETRKITEYVIKNARCPVILDADGINCISGNINILKDNSQLVCTPHPAEFSRMTGTPVNEIQTNRIDSAKLFAKESGAIIVLKGVHTVIASPDGRTAVNKTGNAGLAKAGTGDVLTGIIASLAAQGMKLFEAACLGVFLHGLAADKLAETRSLSGMTASDIVEIIGSI